jgi:hydroxyethylthiazole kinase-like uncharacterized protein yjeF
VHVLVGRMVDRARVREHGAMRSAHTVSQVRDAEAPLLASLPDGQLMQRAVAGLTSHAARRLPRVYGSRVVVLAGGGDNGGDAIWAGTRLAARGAQADVLAPGRTHPAGTAALLAAGGRLHVLASDGDRASDDLAASLLGRADLVLDGLLGIGARGGLRPDYARLARLAPPARTVAVDVPSGVDPDTGAVPGEAVRASSTVTFGTFKRGLLLTPGAEYAGTVELVDIGLSLPPPDLTALDAVDVAQRLARPQAQSSKYSRGVVGIVAGSDPYPGAAVLAVGGALRGGAGYVRVATTPEAARAVRNAHPEAVVTALAPGDADGVFGVGRVQAWAVGSGLVPGAPTTGVVAALLGAPVPVLLDAGALGAYAELFAEGHSTVRPTVRSTVRERTAPLLLTPHDGEFVRLTGTALGWDAEQTAAGLSSDRLGVARRAASALGATVLLKGARTVVADPGGNARVNTTGTPWLATAGSGDVLTGLCGAVLATGLDGLDAGSVGAWLHGRAAELAGPAPSAADLPVLLVDVLAEVAG